MTKDKKLELMESVDSYGDNPEITELQFVEPITKTITDYQVI